MNLKNISAFSTIFVVIFSSIEGNNPLPTETTLNSTILMNNSITFRVCNKTVEKHRFKTRQQQKPASERILSLPEFEKNNCTEILKMSNFSENGFFSDNGFVRTVIDAYNHHHNLVLRPDDIWAAIMTQFSFYVNKHAEPFRGKFVNFEGKRQLRVYAAGSLRTFPYDNLVKLMSIKIQQNLIDPQMKDWIVPNFTTTTENDVVTMGVVFMATVKKYFDYKYSTLCGIPKITLEGTVDDWKDILGRLEKLKEYKLQSWYDILEPIVQQFVDARAGKVDKKFWQKIVDVRGGSGRRYITGWITAFCAIDEKGNWQGSEKMNDSNWLRIHTTDIPTGIVQVDVKISDMAGEYDGLMIAGHVAVDLKDDGETLQPALGWAIAI